MLTIYNKYIPFGSYSAIMLFGTIWHKKEDGLDLVDRNHEYIHAIQWVEVSVLSAIILGIISIFTFHWWYCLIPMFAYYVIYVLEFSYQKVIWLFNKDMKPYYFITFEQEAYDNECNLSYMSERKWFYWLKYVFKWIKY